MPHSPQKLSRQMQLRPRYSISFSLLLLTYAYFGWRLAVWASGSRAWAIVTLLVLILSELLASPWSIVRRAARWLNSDRRAFVTAMASTIAVICLLLHVELLTNLMLLVSAGLLVRLDLQMAQFSGWRAFAVLLGVAGVGIGIGWVAYHGLTSELLANRAPPIEWWNALRARLPFFP